MCLSVCLSVRLCVCRLRVFVCVYILTVLCTLSCCPMSTEKQKLSHHQFGRLPAWLNKCMPSLIGSLCKKCPKPVTIQFSHTGSMQSERRQISSEAYKRARRLCRPRARPMPRPMPDKRTKMINRHKAKHSPDVACRRFDDVTVVY